MAIADFTPETAPKLRKGPPCTVCEALATLPPSEAEALNRHLRNPRYRYSLLSEDLAKDKDNPLEITANTLARHARGKCGARTKMRSETR